MNVEQITVVESVEMVQDYIVEIELSVVLREHKQVAQYIGANDFTFTHDQIEDVHSVFILLKDGTKVRKELFDAHIVSDGANDAVLKGNFFIEFDENGTDIDGAYNKVVNKFDDATVEPFELSTFDIPEEYVEEIFEDADRVVISVVPVDAKLKFSLEENYGDN